MGHPTSFGQPSCLVWLAAAFLVLGLCLVQQGAGRQRPHQWKSSEAALSVSPAGDIVDKYSRDSTEGENTVSEGEAEGSRGGSWLEQEGVELRSPSQDSQTGTSTASPTGFRRLLRRLRFWRRGSTRGSDDAAEVSRRTRVPLHTRLLQHLRRVARIIRHGVSAAAGRLFGRVRQVEAERPQPVFTEGDPPDLETNSLYYRDKVPGQGIIQEILRQKPGIAHHPESFSVVAADERVSRTLWAEGGVVRVASELGQPGRVLVRGRRIGLFRPGMQFEATDQATGEPMTALVGHTVLEATARDVDSMRNEGLAVGLFQKVKNPYLANRYLRFLAPFDLVTIPGKPLVQKAKSRNEVGWVKNLLFLLPPTHVDMETFVDEIGRFPQEDRPLADAARLYLTVQAVRLVAHLQDEGVVHGKIMPDSFCLKREGGLYLRDFGSLVRAGAKVVVPAEYDEYTPPEGRAAARSRFGSGATTMTYAFDAWTLGSVIFLIWCSRAPDTKSGYEYSVEFFFSRCRRVPENVKLLVYKLINPSVEARLLALQAIETPEYREMEEQLSAASRLYSGDGTLTGGDDDMPPLET
ncbi:rhoptry protein ROP4 [Toxoplasma gondii]|uniref:Rhoptry protein 4 n=5 Tax=Toxoplasma gondii TaxID=5811 RepID=ROP4_TOXGO|nr:RecName: Full=Rhoptry protein 4; Flags: Precursor [Toxoplasma gondii]CAJ20303.1 rhoptry protein 4 [Toxoplasma gondii RH]AAU87405.1 rhoptry protein 4 [Toxoplasma gondii]ABU24469.1 secretory rhoptry protein 4 [Toxoplasma gondii]KAF4646233.1 rhoptry protein ROP4 [Toxoplasma gondii]QDQ69396.1 ROP4_1 [Toxoplasma gondii]